MALSKADALDADTLKSQVAKLKRAAGRAPLILSSASRKGVPEALRALQAEIDASAEAERKPVAAWQAVALDRLFKGRLLVHTRRRRAVPQES